MPAINPFIWDQAIDDGIGRADFARETALQLKSGQHVAMFGARGIGKSSFTLELAKELAQSQGEDAPPWESIRIDLRRAISIPAFVGAISYAVDNHPEKAVRRRISGAFKKLEKEIGVNLGVFRAGIKSVPGTGATNESEVLFGQMAALRTLDRHLVVIFDEFQRLNNCPGEPLSIIRSALMEPGEGQQVSLFLTGSMRERLDLMLHSSTEPIWDQTHDVEIPEIGSEEFLTFLELRFDASGKPIDENAVEELIAFTNLHPKRTQHLAWMAWEDTHPGSHVTVDEVRGAWEKLVAGVAPGVDFGAMLDQLLTGDSSDVSSAKALLLIGAGHSAGSTKSAKTYGLSDATTTRRALERMRNRGVVKGSGSRWEIVDPLYAEWLRRQDPAGFLLEP